MAKDTQFGEVAFTHSYTLPPACPSSSSASTCWSTSFWLHYLPLTVFFVSLPLLRQLHSDSHIILHSLCPFFFPMCECVCVFSAFALCLLYFPLVFHFGFSSFEREKKGNSCVLFSFLPFFLPSFLLIFLSLSPSLSQFQSSLYPPYLSVMSLIYIFSFSFHQCPLHFSH